LPEKWHGLRDVEIRYRRRYVDLIANDEVRKAFKLRSELIKSIRNYLDAEGYMEVETPMMQPIPGGARAKPFQTHHEALGLDLFLRVAPELYLKRLLVGGFEKVYEINRNFRNEGLSVRHNPEFTMLELYASYGDLSDMIEITEGLIESLVKKVHGQDTVRFGDQEINFKRPWKRIAFYEALKEKTGVDWRKADLRKEAAKLKPIAVRATMSHAVDTLNALGIPCDVRVLSAHRTPKELAQYVEQAGERGVKVFIAVADKRDSHVLLFRIRFNTDGGAFHHY